MYFGAAAPHCLPHAQAQRQAECRLAPCRCGGGHNSIVASSGAFGGWLAHETGSWIKQRIRKFERRIKSHGKIINPY